MVGEMTAPALSAGAWFGIGAALTQALAVGIFAAQIARGACRPNALSWAMWIYGALVMLLFQAGIGVPREVLALPAVVVLGGFAVVTRAVARTAALPVEAQDWLMLALNAGIVAWSLLLLGGPVADLGIEQELGPVFALLSGAAAVTAAWPLLRTTCLDPSGEHPLPWFVGSGAHGLGALAVMSAGLSWHYLVYPVLCQAVHLLIGVFALGEGESVIDARGGKAR